MDYDNIIELIKNLIERIETLERNQTLGSISFEDSDTLTIPVYTSDPSSATGGQIYYNSTTGKFRKYDAVAGAWKNFEDA